MKTKSIIIAILGLLCFCLLFSCAIEDGSEGPDNGTEKPDVDTEQDDDDDVKLDFIYDETSELVLVIPDGQLSEKNRKLFTDTLYPYKLYSVTDGTGKEAEHEIIFGECDRELSRKAYRLLELQEKNESDEVGYVIVSDGKSLAIAYDEGRYGARVAEDAAIECLVTKYISAYSLTVSQGCTDNVVLDTFKYQKSKDEVLLAEKWEEHKKTLEKEHGKELAEEIIEAFKGLYDIYDDNLIIWLADLYDPDTGGFYYSNSARNTEGFLPDLESTTQALGVIQNSGIAKSLEGEMDELIPEEMKEQIVKWVKSLQDSESGYFYHPQWGKKTTDQYPARRGRDLQWAINILTRFGAAPTYDTPSGNKGDGITADQYTRGEVLPARLGVSPSRAVSQVLFVNASDASVPAHLLNDVNFMSYLEGLSIKTRSYNAGNILESQVPEILQRDKVLASRGEKYSLVDILYSFLNENQNESTGLWQEDGATDYHAVNGLLKIASTYSKIGKEIPRSLVSIRAAMDCIGSEEEPAHVCDVLNPWYAVTVVLENMEKHSASGKENAKKTRNEIASDAPNLIKITAKKISVFVKEDGSFSYYPAESAANSQGLPTAVAKTNEGDVNATMICSQSIPGHIVTALGLTRIPICTEANRIEFTKTLENLSTIIKDRKDDKREEAVGKNYGEYGGECYEVDSTKGLIDLYRSDYYLAHDTVGEYYESASDAAQKQEYLNMQYDEESSNTYLEYGKAKSAGYYRGIYLRTSTNSGTGCFVFETDIKIDRVSEESLKRIVSSKIPYLCDIKIAEITSEIAGESNANTCYGDVGRIYVLRNSDGEYEFRLGPVVPSYAFSVEMLGPAMKMGEWNTVAIELYSNGVAKYFLNNKCFADMTAVNDTDNIDRCDAIRFAFSADAASSAVHIDMTLVGKINREYKRGDNYIDLDAYAFRAGEYHKNFGGVTYDSQPNSDSDSFFRASWYGIWGETLQSNPDRMNNPNFKREGVAMISGTEKSGKSGKIFEYGKGSYKDYYNGVYYGMHNDAKNGAVYVFETDFRLGTISQATLDNLADDPCLMDITLARKVAISSGDFDVNESLLTVAGIYLAKNESGKYVWYLTDKRDGYSADGNFGAELSSSKWYTLTVEVYADGMAKYYVDGVAMGDRRLDVTDIELGKADVLRISLTESVIASSVKLDNTFFGKVDKAYVANDDYVYVPPTLPVTPEEPEEDEKDGDSLFDDDFVISDDWT